MVQDKASKIICRPVIIFMIKSIHKVFLGLIYNITGHIKLFGEFILSFQFIGFSGANLQYHRTFFPFFNYGILLFQLIEQVRSSLLPGE